MMDQIEAFSQDRKRDGGYFNADVNFVEYVSDKEVKASGKRSSRSSELVESVSFSGELVSVVRSRRNSSSDLPGNSSAFVNLAGNSSCSFELISVVGSRRTTSHRSCRRTPQRRRTVNIV
ncbi:hypothetical protein Bca101_059807 [Brassica carinata]